MSSEPASPRDETIELPFVAPLYGAGLFEFFALRAVPGVEAATASTYRRAVRLAHGDAIVALDAPDPAGAGATLRGSVVLSDERDRAAAAAMLRGLFDLDADSGAIDAALSDGSPMAELVRRRPGVRVPGTADPHELVVRAIIGQQVSVAGARTIAARLTERYGASLGVVDPTGAITRQFPSAAALAAVDPETLPMPRARGRSLVATCRALAEGTVHIEQGRDPLELRRELTALAGIGPWTADYVILRCLGHPDVFLDGDLAVRRAAQRLGMDGDRRRLATAAQRWRPWRSYATLHLWLSLGD